MSAPTQREAIAKTVRQLQDAARKNGAPVPTTSETRARVERIVARRERRESN